MDKQQNAQNLPFDDGLDYRNGLLKRSYASVRKAQYMLDAYKSLAVCILSETQNDDSLPGFIESLILENFYDETPEPNEKNIIDFAVAQAEVFAGCETLDSNYECVKHAFIDKQDFASLDPEQLWVFYIPNAMFVHMDLMASGRIPEHFDSKTPYIFSTYNKQHSNGVLEKQIEIASFTVEILEPVIQAMIGFLDNRMGLGGDDIKPHYFTNLVKMAKRDGHDTSKPLQTNIEFSWLDMYWDAVLVEEDRLKQAANDIEIPAGTILQ